MAVEKRRLLYEFYVLSTKETPTRSFELAEEIGISIRTFKSDIDDLKQFALASGARLESKNGIGYWLEVDDYSIYNPVKEQLDISFNSIDYEKGNVTSRRNDILRMIIATDDYIKVEDIASSLYLSVSAIRKNLKDARDLLNTYHLTLDSKKEKGLKVIGDEFEIRMCMIELLEKHFSKAMHLFKDLDFSQYFLLDENTSNQIRKVILNELRNDDVALLDKYVNRLCKYYVLVNNRVKKYKLLEFSSAAKQKLQKYPYRDIAEKIVTKLNEIPKVYIPDEEIDSTQLLLLIWADYYKNIDIKNSFSPIYRKVVKMRNFILDFLYNCFHIDLSSIEECNEVIDCGLLAICLKMEFNVNSYLYMEKQMAGTSLHYSGVISILTKKIIASLEKEYKTTFSNADVTVLANRLYYLIDKIHFDYRPVSLAICSRNGAIGAEIIRNKILRRYNKEWFKKLDVQEYYCLRKYDKYDYDYILLNFPAYSYRYEIPYMQVSQIMTNEEILDLYNNILVKTYQIADVLEDFNFNEDSFYDDYEYESQKAFITMLAYKNGKDSNCIQSFMKVLEETSSYHIADNTCFILCDSLYTKWNCFELYDLKKKCTFGNYEINSILFVSCDIGFNLQKLKYIELVVYYLMRFPDKKEELIKLKDINHLNSFVYECLTNG